LSLNAITRKQTNEDGIARHMVLMGEKKNACRSFVGKPVERRQFGRA
jgi:hypothetical protein